MAQSSVTRPSGPDTAGSPSLLARLNARGFRLIMIGDAVVVLAALVVPMLVRHGPSWPSYPMSAYLAAYAAIVVLQLVVLYLGGLHERLPRLGSRPELPRIVAAVTGALLIVALAELLSGIFLVPRANLPVVLVLASAGLLSVRTLAERVRMRREGPPRVLLVGGPEEIALARTHLHDTEHRSRVVDSIAGPEGLVEAVERSGATDVLLVSSEGIGDLYPEPLTTLEERGVGVLQRVTARDTLLGLQSVREIGGMPFTRLRTHALPVSRAHAKRALELALVVAAAPVLVPAGFVVAVWVLAVAGRPVLYRQERVGRGGEAFSMAKFRTMVRNAEQMGQPVIAARHDPRVVRGCGWLRATRLDELPQLWHVVRGQMSLVGPRPERPQLTARYEALIPGYARRHEIPPGITGLAQVHGRYHTDPAYKLGYDLQYLVNWSPVLDLQILLQTVWVIVSRKV